MVAAVQNPDSRKFRSRVRYLRESLCRFATHPPSVISLSTDQRQLTQGVPSVGSADFGGTPLQGYFRESGLPALRGVALTRDFHGGAAPKPPCARKHPCFIKPLHICISLSRARTKNLKHFIETDEARDDLIAPFLSLYNPLSRPREGMRCTIPSLGGYNNAYGLSYRSLLPYFRVKIGTA